MWVLAGIQTPWKAPKENRRHWKLPGKDLSGRAKIIMGKAEQITPPSTTNVGEGGNASKLLQYTLQNAGSCLIGKDWTTNNERFEAKNGNHQLTENNCERRSNTEIGGREKLGRCNEKFKHTNIPGAGCDVSDQSEMTLDINEVQVALNPKHPAAYFRNLRNEPIRVIWNALHLDLQSQALLGTLFVDGSALWIMSNHLHMTQITPGDHLPPLGITAWRYRVLIFTRAEKERHNLEQLQLISEKWTCACQPED